MKTLLLCVAIAFQGFNVSSVTQFADRTTTPRASFTETVVLFYFKTTDEMLSRLVLVPSMPNHIPYLCLQMQNKRGVECFYIGKDDGVTQITVILDEEKT